MTEGKIWKFLVIITFYIFNKFKHIFIKLYKLFISAIVWKDLDF